MFKNTALAHAVNKKVQHLYGDFGAAAIKDGFDGNLIFDAMIISDIFCSYIVYDNYVLLIQINLCLYLL